MQAGIWIGLLRQLLHVIGGILVALGLLSEDMLDPFIGLGFNAATLIWWLVERHYNIKAAEHAVLEAHERGRRQAHVAKRAG